VQFFFYTCERSKNRPFKKFAPSPWPIGLGMEVSNLKNVYFKPFVGVNGVE